ncbi:MAG: Maf family protein [Saprospiraceae bacterium]
MVKKFILGSQSPRRQQLLQLMNIPFEVRVPNVVEDFPVEMDIRKVAEYLAGKKATALLDTLNEDEILITADSTVICHEKIYNKPENKEEAIFMLKQLSAHRHEVITGVWIGNKEINESFSDTTLVDFARMTEEEINFYVNNQLPLDKAGAYGIQDWIGVSLVKSITGSYTNVMGLPTHRVYKILSSYTT